MGDSCVLCVLYYISSVIVMEVVLRQKKVLYITLCYTPY